MKTWLIAAIAVGVLVVAGLPALAVVLASNDDGPDRHREHSAQGPRQGPGHGPGKHNARKHQPPRHAGPLAPRARAPRSAVTPEQAKEIATRAQQRATALKTWADCLAAGKDDCAPPLPQRPRARR